VVGNTGSGKTTVSSELARRLESRHIELDALNWGPDWTPKPTEMFRRHTTDAISGDKWIVDGNYSLVRDIVWPRAQVLVWLDYSFLASLRQLFMRTARRIMDREELWAGNRERLTTQLFSRDSIFWWLITTHRRYRTEYTELLASDAFNHLKVVRLESRRETKKWLDEVAPPLSRSS
jgi:adenylate kinase family enzyme